MNADHYLLFRESYLAQLERNREKYRNQREVQAAVQRELNRPLTERIQEWWDALPGNQRQGHYTMDFFSAKFEATPNKVGPALHNLGWKRKRNWSMDGPHQRVWSPPVISP